MTASQQTPLVDAVRAMSVLTGVELSEQRLGKGVPIVELVLDYSRSLRALELRDLEPATSFRAR